MLFCSRTFNDSYHFNISIIASYLKHLYIFKNFLNQLQYTDINGKKKKLTDGQNTAFNIVYLT